MLALKQGKRNGTFLVAYNDSDTVFDDCLRTVVYMVPVNILTPQGPLQCSMLSPNL